MRTQLLLATTCAVIAAGCQSSASTQGDAYNKGRPAADRTMSRAPFGRWGLDLASEDKTIRPGDDFYRYTNGKWLTREQIPADQESWSPDMQLVVQAEAQVRDIVESLSRAADQGSIDQKVGDYYRAYTDIATINQKGITPARPALETIQNASSVDDIVRIMSRHDLDAATPIGLGVTVDERNPDRYIVVMDQSGLGLPDREYYLRADDEFQHIRSSYAQHVARMLLLAGEKDTEAHAEAVLALETRIAQCQWPIAKLRDRNATYNLRARSQLDALVPAFPWHVMFEAAGLADQSELIVREPDAIAALATLVSEVPLSTWRSYLEYHYLSNTARFLSEALDDEDFSFYGHILSGQESQSDRWRRAVEEVNRALGEAVGELYVKRHFPPEAKEQALLLVKNLQAAYAQRIRNLPWMTSDTKRAALEKLAAFRLKIGYPEKWRDYSQLEVRPGDAFGNRVRVRAFNWQRSLNHLKGPVDRGEWVMAPQTVNAYYSPSFNEIVFPAAFLQPPYFDLHADSAVNYGAIGAVIGHEMTHGFDDQGAKSDARGVLRNWWGRDDEAAFKQRTDLLVQQYDRYVPMPGLKVNGALTLGENIADLGGVSIALDAYHHSLGNAQSPILNGLTGDQRFFLSWAQIWRTVIRDPSLRNQVMSNPHSPAEFRVNGVVRNLDAWYDTFDIRRDDKLYLRTEERVSIW